MENIDNCPICGGFLSSYRWTHNGVTLIRSDCYKCGFAFRNVREVMYERFALIREGKTKEERQEIARKT